MLEALLRYLKNWFIADVYEGAYTIQNGGITLPFLMEGQYFRIIGSILNDGLYRYGDAQGLSDEVFCGTVWALAVPQAILEIALEIEAWEIKNGGGSPYLSESFKEYSYSKGTNANGQAATWQDVFRPRLNQWRKVREG